MSQHNIARSALEGGRNSFNKNQRRESHRKERVQERAFLAHARAGTDDFYAYPERPVVQKEFTDKLNPAKGWLDKQAKRGIPWDRVYARLVRTFDARTTAGRHILYCHMLGYVNHDAEHRNRYGDSRYDYEVNTEGRLERGREYWRKSYPKAKQRPERRTSPDNVAVWLGDRRVARIADTLYWLEGTSRIERACEEKYCFKEHLKQTTQKRRLTSKLLQPCFEYVTVRYHLAPIGRFRQSRALTEREVRQWDRWPVKFRAEMLMEPAR